MTDSDELKYYYKKLTIRIISMRTPRLFKIRFTNDWALFIFRLDLFHRTLYIIYRKKGFVVYLSGDDYS